ncbi:MAG: hypothetical protein RL754_1025 [Bacteroidota bacterium]|jgi:O-succinylbenzoic acid--CoA ligase
MREAQFVYNGISYAAAQFIELESEELWVKDIQKVLSNFIANEPHFPISTSGSTGKPKLVEHPRKRLVQSAYATLEFFELEPGDRALLVLPAKYIGGAMMIIRAYLGNLELHLQEPSGLPVLDRSYNFVPLTPAQYIRLLESNLSGLKRIEYILLGGAPLHPRYDKARKDLSVYVGYGMTETASHVALRPLGEYYYEAVGSTTFAESENDTLIIRAPHLDITMLLTTDMIELRDERHFRYLGRQDFVINSGGVKIQPEVIEDILQAENIDAYISYKEDHIYGQVPVLVLDKPLHLSAAKQLITKLPRLWRPRWVTTVQDFPILASGKIDRASLALLIKSHPDRLYLI